MNNDLFIEMECKQFTKKGQVACGDDYQLMSLENENRSLAVLSDGLGSGVKAHLLANMTTTMALRFMRSNMDILSSVETIMDSLPVCEVRKISYATFSMVDLRLGGKTQVVEMGNPQYIHLRGTVEIPAQNHRKIVFVMPAESDNAGSFGMRLQGYRDAMADCGLAAQPPVQWHSVTHRSEIRSLLESGERPDALFVANDVMAIEIMQLAEMLHLSVPDDVSIAGLENMHRSTLSTPQLTTVGYDKRLLAEECVRLLFEHIDNRNVGVTTRKVPMELIVRGSTAEKRQ